MSLSTKTVRSTKTSAKASSKSQPKASKPAPSARKAAAARLKELAKAPLDPNGKASTISEKLFQAAWLAGSGMEAGDNKAAAKETVAFLREEPVTVEALSRFDSWLAHRTATGSKAFKASLPFLLEGKTDSSFVSSAEAVGGEDAKTVMEHGIQGLRSGGVSGAIAALVKLSETFKPTGKLTRVAPALNKAATVAPGLKDAEVVHQAKNVGLDLVLAVHDLKDPAKKKWQRAGGLIKATAQLALWVMMAATPAPVKA